MKRMSTITEQLSQYPVNESQQLIKREDVIFSQNDEGSGLDYDNDEIAELSGSDLIRRIIVNVDDVDSSIENDQ